MCIIDFAVMCMLLLGLCGSVMAYADNSDIETPGYSYKLRDTGTTWSGE